MKLSLSWLNDYVDLSDVPVADLVDRLTLAVCEVDGVAESFAHLDGIHVAEIKSVEKHPDADRLNVCQVADGKATHQIVCGAPNVRAGMIAPLATLGAKLPKADGTTLEIKAAKLRGVASSGMLCSPGELGLTPLTGEIDGLLDLAAFTEGIVTNLVGAPEIELKHGTPLTDALPLKDTILDIDNKSITHRPDLWCHFGFAREIAAIYRKPLKYDPLNDRAPQKLKSDAKLPVKKIEIEDGAAKAYFGRSLSGVRVVPSPLKMQARLLNVGQRPINNIVDASNYVMLELGQPNHTFDAATLKADVVSAVRANRGAKSYQLKTFTTLDGQAREIPADTILILDGPAKSARPVALGGIMGGEDSGVSDDTAALFLESATFPRELIRPAIAKIGLRTDSAQRFEKGQDPAKAKAAIERLSEIIALSCPDLTAGKIVGENPEQPERAKVRVDLDFLRRRLGFEISAELVEDILTRLQFEVKTGAGKTAGSQRQEAGRTADNVVFQITAPTYRSQYDIGIPEDIVEELGRIYGYDHITPQPPTAAVQPTPPNRERLLSNRIKQYLVTAGGYSEAFGYSFATAEDNAHFRPHALYAAGYGYQSGNAAATTPPVAFTGEPQAQALQNPVFMDRPELRLAQLPGLLRQIAGNQDRFDDVRLFEYGRVYYKTATDAKTKSQPGPLATESKRFTIVHQPPAGATDSNDLDERPEFHALLDLRGLLTRLSGDIAGDSAVHFRRLSADAVPGYLHPGAALELVARIPGDTGEMPIGCAGLLHPGTQAAFDLKRPVVLADLDYTALFVLADSARQRIAYRPPSVFPDSRFELSLILDEAIGSDRPVTEIEALQLPEIREIRLLTIYRGAPLPAGKKSVSYELRAARDGGTLSGEELQSLLDRCVERLAVAGYPLR